MIQIGRILRLAEDEEDRSLAGKAATSDDVVLMVLLRPWQDSEHPTGTCVVSAQLHDEQSPSGEAVRSLQARGLTRTIAAFNADVQLPIILCGSMNCLPSSGTYEILCKGVQAQDPGKPGPAGKPLVDALSTSSARIRWSAPPEDHEALSPPVDHYQIIWVPGGSRFLPGESVNVRESDCLVYDLVETESGNVKTVQNPLRSFIVTGLSSGVAYEFRVSAVNALGQGPWGERSEAIRMHFLAGNDPEDKELLSAASIKKLRGRELVEAKRRAAERLADPRAYELRKLVKVHGLVDLDSEKFHPFDSASGLTPRYADALLHPNLANARTDAGYPIIELVKEVDSAVGMSTGGRRRRGQRKAKGSRGQSQGTRSIGSDRDICSMDGNQSCGTGGSFVGAPTDDEQTAQISPHVVQTATKDADSTAGVTLDTVTDRSVLGDEQDNVSATGQGKGSEAQGEAWNDTVDIVSLRLWCTYKARTGRTLSP